MLNIEPFKFNDFKNLLLDKYLINNYYVSISNSVISQYSRLKH